MGLSSAGNGDRETGDGMVNCNWMCDEYSGGKGRKGKGRQGMMMEGSFAAELRRSVGRSMDEPLKLLLLRRDDVMGGGEVEIG